MLCIYSIIIQRYSYCRAVDCRAEMPAEESSDSIAVSTGELSITAKVSVVYGVIASTSQTSGS